jgi:hypothetical protein
MSIEDITEHANIEQIASERLRDVARGAEQRGAAWNAWLVIIDGQAADLLEYDGRLWLANGDLVIESTDFPTESPTQAVLRMLGERARAEAARTATRDDVLCALFLRFAGMPGGPGAGLDVAEAAVRVLDQRGLLEAMHRVVMR